MTWNTETLAKIDVADDLKIAPFRADGVTHGTPTWIWSVVVDGHLCVRAYNGQGSRWYQSAVKQKAGIIVAAGNTYAVGFVTIDGPLNDQVDDAYRAKYSASPYLRDMTNARTRAATVEILPTGAEGGET